jgi:Mg2+ and Co2+ transporter CorA
MSRAFWGSSRVTYFLKFGLGSLQPTEEQMTKLDDLHESVIHQLDMISNLKEMLTDIITIHQTNISNWLAIISNRINSSIKLLTWIMLIMTGLTLVLTVPNTMATIFGIPYFGLSSEASHYIAAILVASLIVPIIIFLIYWKSIRRKALEVERQNV